MKQYFTLFYLFQFQLPRNLRLGHCELYSFSFIEIHEISKTISTLIIFPVRAQPQYSHRHHTSSLIALINRRYSCYVQFGCNPSITELYDHIMWSIHKQLEAFQTDTVDVQWVVFGGIQSRVVMDYVVICTAIPSQYPPYICNATSIPRCTFALTFLEVASEPLWTGHYIVVSSI